MDIKDINKKLSSLYSTWNIVKTIDDYNSKKDDSHKVAYPLFLKTDEEYENGNKKLMIFGQETYGWDPSSDPEFYGPNMTDNLMKCYYYILRGDHNTTFFQVAKKFVYKLQEKFQNNTVSYSWNNIVKVGYKENKSGYSIDFYEKYLKPNSNKIINMEIEILRPDYILFFSGPNYDNVLNDVFNNPKRIAVKGVPERQLCEIVIPNVKKAFRTYHPNYLQRQKITDKYLNIIIKEIMK